MQSSQVRKVERRVSFKRYLLVLGVFVVPALYALGVSLGGSNGPGRQLFMPKAPTAIVQPSGGPSSVDEVVKESEGWKLPSVAPTASPGGVERPSLLGGQKKSENLWMVSGTPIVPVDPARK